MDTENVSYRYTYNIVTLSHKIHSYIIYNKIDGAIGNSEC